MMISHLSLWRLAALAFCVLAVSACDETEPQTSADVLADTTPFELPTCGTSSCADEELCCDFECVDASSSTAHCGGCGVSCEGTESCIDGACRCGDAICGVDQACCDDGCVDLESNPSHCGTCGGSCESDSRCLEGGCVCVGAQGSAETCLDGEICCPGQGCARLDTDPESCGACGAVCGAGERCEAGACVCGSSSASDGPVCGSGEACCNDTCLPADDAQCTCGASSCVPAQLCCGDSGSEACTAVSSSAVHCGACGVTCAAGESCRGGTCACDGNRADCDGDTTHGCEAELDFDPANCGACGLSCASGEVCDGEGRCATTCQPGTTLCGDRCVSVATSELHCGACDVGCASGELCNGTGQCATSCQVGLTQCGTRCANTLSDRASCGACGVVCPAGTVCNGEGLCALSCQQGLVDCGGSCVDLASSLVHCGACGNLCASGQVCSQGQCVTECQSGLTSCGGACIPLETSFAHCGTCGAACEPGQICDSGACVPSCPTGQIACGGVCVDPTASQDHCGGCGRACDVGYVCNGSTCIASCPEGWLVCDGVCANPVLDRDHCGGCGQTCASDERCSGGSCIPAADCGSRVLCDGRCVDIATDSAHCGSCNAPCGLTEQCQAGTCTCRAGWESCGGGSCDTNTSASTSHCGACNAPCQAGEICQAGVCGCPANKADCDGNPNTFCETSLLTDAAHCGACGAACAANEFCVDGACFARPAIGLSKFDQMACAVASDGSLKCWGDARDGALGDGTDSPSAYARYEPQDVVGLDGSDPVVDVNIGQTNACAVTASGAAWCWGSSNTYGELGCGACTQSGTPQQVTGIDGISASALTVHHGWLHVCALLADGTVACWGDNNYGQLGNGTTTDSNIPIVVPGLSGVIKLDEGLYSACALLDTNAISCWGRGYTGILGNGGSADTLSPTLVVGLDGTQAEVIVDIAVGSSHACALLDTQEIRCWGDNERRQIGDATGTRRLEPVEASQVTGLGDYVALEAGEDTTCVWNTDGSVLCWGYSNNCSIQDSDTRSGVFRPVPLAEPPGGRVDLTFGKSQVCGHDPTGTLFCHGTNTYGVAGQRHWSRYPQPIEHLSTDIVAMDLTTTGGCLIDSAGDVFCWGNNDSYRATTTVTSQSVAPVVQVPGVANATRVTTSPEHSCALLASGAVWCWGKKSLTATGFSRNPGPVFGLDGNSAKAIDLSSGVEHTCVLLDDGTVSCWGVNDFGQLGLPLSETGANGPTPVQGLSGLTVVDIEAKRRTTCALTDQGALYCWGYSNNGSFLGSGTGSREPVPLIIGDVDGTTVSADQIALSRNGTMCILHDAGALDCWGYNVERMASASSVLQAPRTPHPDIDGVQKKAIDVVIADSQTCVVLDTGAVECWGGGGSLSGAGYGVIPGRSNTPVSPLTLDGTQGRATALPEGVNTGICAILDTGRARCWGSNSFDLLGVGGVSQLCTPAPVTLP